MGVDREPLTFDYGNLHVRVDRGVFELFVLDGSGADHTFRVPLRWLGVALHYKKPGKPGTLPFGQELSKNPDGAGGGRWAGLGTIEEVGRSTRRHTAVGH
ncbi:hypothetical protein [Micromonospora carbonacea]|uniref:Uncharacterized protein n=1 Tax=Micromonospora carbonacea TaxID=47853 RepID=A0A7H8XNF0_9ACTN|nr:hypothetical protein [Micromonospora carbonacea]MBB5825385.1 hypothetical protein [Micromonospora carbonacea]QLD26557.1 hypothetical protein HXZ27_22000 [Micromonospora carbonacea]